MESGGCEKEEGTGGAGKARINQRSTFTKGTIGDHQDASV